MRQFGNNHFAQQSRHRHRQQQQQRQRMGGWAAQQKRLADQRRHVQANPINQPGTAPRMTFQPSHGRYSETSGPSSNSAGARITAGRIIKTIIWSLVLLPLSMLGIAAFIGFAFQGATDALPFFILCALVVTFGATRLRAIWSGGKPGLFARNVLKGEVRGLQKGMEPLGNRNMEVLSFRLENYDARGNRLAPIPIQMRGLKFIGTIHEGDHLVIKARRPGHGTLQVKKLYNATTRATVRAKKPSLWFLDLIFFAIAIGAFATICAAINAGMSSF